MGQHEIFGVHHPLHPETAACIGIGHADIVGGDVENLSQLILGTPDALAVDGYMDPVALHLSIATARLHRVHDDAVVTHIQADDIRSLGKGGIGRILIPHVPVIGHIVGGLGMDRLAARVHIHLGRQIVIVQHDHLGRIAGLRHGVGHNHGNGFPDKAQAVLGQNGAHGGGPVTAIAVLDCGATHRDVQARRLKVASGIDRMHAISGFRIRHIQFRDHRMSDRRAEHETLQRVGGCNVINIAALSGQKTNVFGALDGLAFSELFHGGNS
mmetsp:Transcript_100/g.286  ORF Transcript_100/g.286 Transcript_100/m.286 type:complete len:269 (+) Transcript_100:4126-4932(+)